MSDINTDQGTSRWLSALPIEEEGYMHNKQQFRDLVNFRYDWPLFRTPRACTCWNYFNIEHALTCAKKEDSLHSVTID